MNWNRFIILIVSIICFAGVTKLVMACADMGDPYSEPSFFLNTINRQPAFVPFYYTPSLVFYTDGYGYEEYGYNDKLADQNLILWRAYTGKEVTKADIDSFVYKFRAKDVDNLYLHIKKKEPLLVEDNVANNGLTKWFIEHKDAEAVQYLAFAKVCEPCTVPLEAKWNNKANDWVTPKRDSAAMRHLIHTGIQHYDVAKKEEIKLRYAYQVLRMAFYSEQYLQVISLFNTMVTDRKDNFLYCRCLGLKAGALYKTKKNTEAAYLYSLVFDKSDENKRAIYTSFRWAVNGNIKPVLDLCKNDHEKAVVYVMQGLYDYDGSDKNMLSVLQKAYEYDPKVKGLDIVMTRDINKLERSFIPYIAATKSKDALLSELNTFSEKVAKDGLNGNQVYWFLSSAYVSLLNGEAATCKEYLDKAAAEKMKPQEQEVHSIINVLYVMGKDEKITAKTEEELLPLLEATEDRANKEKRYPALFSNMMVEVLCAAYKAQGDLEKAIYCYSKAASMRSYSHDIEDYTDDPGKILEGMSSGQLLAAEAFIQKKNKSPFEKWLVENTGYTAGALYELEGTKYIRMFEFDKAVQVLSKVPDSIFRKWQLPDVMVSHILDGQEWNKSDKAVPYNKLKFARKMLELQQKLKKTPTDGRSAYQYANGLYSMSYYGKAHHAYDYYRSSVSQYAYFNYKDRSKLPGYELEHYNVQMPERYYVQAFENADDAEIKARCLFMAAKCWQKNCPVKGSPSYYSPDGGIYYSNTFKNPYLQKLKHAYNNTKFYATATGTCAYFRDYVALQKK